MTGSAWLILWASILIVSFVFWGVVIRGVYRRFRNLQAQVRQLMAEIGALSPTGRTRLSPTTQTSSEEGR